MLHGDIILDDHLSCRTTLQVVVYDQRNIKAALGTFRIRRISPCVPVLWDSGQPAFSRGECVSSIQRVVIWRICLTMQKTLTKDVPLVFRRLHCDNKFTRSAIPFSMVNEILKIDTPPVDNWQWGGTGRAP